YRGTHWQAQNTGQEELEPGTRALIVRKEGNLLIITHP
ncbi:NfeD family protein, partial [Klebsiella pneumoniae]